MFRDRPGLGVPMRAAVLVGMAAGALALGRASQPADAPPGVIDALARQFPPPGLDPLGSYRRWCEGALGAREPEWLEYVYWNLTGTGQSWYHPGQSRYGWAWLARRCSVDLAGQVTRDAFPGPAELFERLDRNRDGVLTEADFRPPASLQAQRFVRLKEMMTESFYKRMDTGGAGRLSREQWLAGFAHVAQGKDHFTAQDFEKALVESMPPNHPFRKNERLKGPKECMARQLFGRVDADGDGRVTRAEWQAFYPQAAAGKGHLTVGSFQAALQASVPPPDELVQQVERVRGPAYADKPNPGDGPGIEPLRVLSFLRGESGSFWEGPALGDTAPDFALRTLGGKEEIRLSAHRGDKVLVLIFGNYT